MDYLISTQSIPNIIKLIKKYRVFDNEGKIEEKTVKRKQKALHFAESYFPN